MEELVALGIAADISHCSYLSRDGKTAYLEEDDDMTLWFKAYEKINGSRPELVERHVENTSIRQLQPYRHTSPEACPGWNIAPLLVDAEFNVAVARAVHRVYGSAAAADIKTSSASLFELGEDGRMLVKNGRPVDSRLGRRLRAAMMEAGQDFLLGARNA